MIDEQKNPQAEVTPDVDALYTESFSRERARKSRRGSLVCGIGAMMLGSFIVHDTVIAIRTGTLVTLGRSYRSIDLPPFIAGPIGVFALLVGLWLLIGLIFRPKGK